MSGTIFLETFGYLSPGGGRIDAVEEDLYSVFRAHSELMGWYVSPRSLAGNCPF